MITWTIHLAIPGSPVTNLLATGYGATASDVYDAAVHYYWNLEVRAVTRRELTP